MQQKGQQPCFSLPPKHGTPSRSTLSKQGWEITKHSYSEAADKPKLPIASWLSSSSWPIPKPLPLIPGLGLTLDSK